MAKPKKNKERVFDDPNEEVKYLKNVIVGLRTYNEQLKDLRKSLVGQINEQGDRIEKLARRNTELKRVNEAQRSAIKGYEKDIESLKNKLEKMKKPWWKRLF